MKVKIDPKQLFLSGQGSLDIRKCMLATIDDDTMVRIQDVTGLDYYEIEYVLSHADISVLISQLPNSIEVEVLDEEVG